MGINVLDAANANADTKIGYFEETTFSLGYGPAWPAAWWGASSTIGVEPTVTRYFYGAHHVSAPHTWVRHSPQRCR